ncbi:MAG: amidohydrolase family protein [Gemmatimonadota bacterium]
MLPLLAALALPAVARAQAPDSEPARSVTDSAAAPPASGALAVTSVTVIDVATGAAEPERTVLIRDGRIEAVVSTDVPLPDDIEVFDAGGGFVIPGLWDAHVHLSFATESALPVLVANGVTTVRDLGSDLAEIDGWRAEIAAGSRVGPRILRAGPTLNGESFNAYQTVTDGPDRARATVRRLARAGVDVIKVHRRVPRDDYFAIVDEANANGLPVVGHIPMTVRPEEASDAGQWIEHTETLFEGVFSDGLGIVELPDSIRGFRSPDGGGAEALFARFVRNDTPVTPVLGAWRYLVQHPDTSVLADPRIRYVARSLREDARESPLITSEQLPIVERLVAEYGAVVRMMARSDVALLTGTDLATAWQAPGFSLHDELAALVDVGASPLQALRAATLEPARLHGMDDELGCIEPGMAADLVILDADPLDDIAHTRRIAAVVVGGEVLDREALDALLRRGERLAERN